MSTIPTTAMESMAPVTLPTTESMGQEDKSANIQYLMYNLIAEIKDSMDDEQITAKEQLDKYKDVMNTVSIKIKEKVDKMVDKAKTLQKWQVAVAVTTGIAGGAMMSGSASLGALSAIGNGIEAMTGLAAGIASVGKGSIQVGSAKLEKEIDELQAAHGSNGSFRSSTTDILTSDIKLENQMQKSYANAQDNLIESKNYQLRT